MKLVTPRAFEAQRWGVFNETPVQVTECEKLGAHWKHTPASCNEQPATATKRQRTARHKAAAAIKINALYDRDSRHRIFKPAAIKRGRQHQAHIPSWPDAACSKKAAAPPPPPPPPCVTHAPIPLGWCVWPLPGTPHGWTRICKTTPKGRVMTSFVHVSGRRAQSMPEVARVELVGFHILVKHTRMFTPV